MNQKLRVGIMGCGWAGEGHAQAYAQLPGVEIAALWSRNKQRAESLAGKLEAPGITVYDRWQDMIEQGTVDILSLATPPTFRVEPFRLALEHRCHILVEKPFTVKLEDAKVLIEAADNQDVVTAACFNWRYAPAVQLMWSEIQAGRIGTILDIRTEWRDRILDRSFYSPRPWAAQMGVGDGELAEGLVHDLDFARFITSSDIERIVSRVRPYKIEQDENYPVGGGSNMHMAEFSNDVWGLFRMTLTAGEAERHTVINGSQGSLRTTGGRVYFQGAEDKDLTEIPIPPGNQIPEGRGFLQFTWDRLIADFVQAVHTGDVNHTNHPHLPTLTDGLRSQEIIAAARKSEEERNWISLSL